MKNVKRFKWLVRLPLSFILGISAPFVGLVHAAEIPALETPVLLNAREQPIDQFLVELFGKLGVPAQVDDAIIGSVNGGFQKTAGEVVHEISAAFQLAVYYDGAVAYIYPSNEISQKILYMSSKSAGSIVRSVNKLALPDARNTLKVTDVGLVVTGSSRFVQQVQSLSKEVKTPAKAPSVVPYSYRIFKLKYAWADDVSLVIGGETVVVPGVASLIRQLVEPGALDVTSSSRQPAPTNLEGLRGQGLKAKGLQQVRQGDTESEPAALSGQALVESSGVVGGSAQQTRIVADPLSNSIIIRDRADKLAGYEPLIESLDKEPHMIEIEATIIDLDTDKLRELGVNWRLHEGSSDALLGNGTAADQLLRPDTSVTPQGSGGIVSLVLGSRQEFIARIRALETQGAARIVSKPHVMTLSNVEALLDTTSTFFVRVAGQEEVDLFDIKVGTKLRVTPHVYEHGNRKQIKLRVNITDGSASDDRTVDSIPIIEESNINTQAIVDVGQSLLIGGLVREMKGNGVSRVPVLGRIPLLGGLFRSQTKTSSRQERMFLITPRVSSTHLAGKRFSAPVLAGSEDDIISSAASRMLGTQESLEKRDEVYPLEQQLPKGDTLTTAQPVNRVPSYSTNDTGPAQLAQDARGNTDKARTLKERLKNPSGPQVASRENIRKMRPQVLATPETANSAAQSQDTQSIEATVAQTGNQDGWQTIFSTPADPGSAPAVAAVVENSAQISKEVSEPSIATDEDGWQVVR